MTYDIANFQLLLSHGLTFFEIVLPVNFGNKIWKLVGLKLAAVKVPLLKICTPLCRTWIDALDVEEKTKDLKYI